MHHRLTASLSVALKKAAGRQRAFEKQLVESEGADAVQLQGDMITANIWRWVWQRGVSSRINAASPSTCCLLPPNPIPPLRGNRPPPLLPLPHLHSIKLPPLSPSLLPRCSIKPGASEVEVESWETGEPLTLQLDPSKGGPVKVWQGHSHWGGGAG